jgi:phosphatidylglycerophosphatase A
MRDRLVKIVAASFGAGYVPLMPGTAGSLIGVAYWWLIAGQTGFTYWLIFAGVAAFAVWCAGEASMSLGQPDPACIVIDEIAAMPLALAGLDLKPWNVLIAFALFRLFDVWKPWPVRQSQNLPGGVGIVIDDLLAALYACGAIHLIIWAAGGISGR